MAMSRAALPEGRPRNGMWGGRWKRMGGEREKGLYELHRAFSLQWAERGDWERFLARASYAAHVAWEHHLSIPFHLWSDEVLEAALHTLGDAASASAAPPRRAGRDTLAFVASTLYDMGGHSETLRIWCDLLREMYPRQSLILTGGLGLQHHFPHLEAVMKERGVEVIKLDCRQPFTSRLMALLALLRGGGYSCAFFFIHPHDALAAAAASACAGDPPCVFFNHADIDFWLGSSCCDRYVDFRSLGAECSIANRGVSSPRVIPLTTDMTRVADIREALGIPRDATVSLSLGSFWKTLADPDFCYFRAVARVLEENRGHYHVFVTSPPGEDALASLMPVDRSVSRRFVITGPYVDTRPFYSSADFLIETFPLVGGSVRVEAMAMGLPIVAFRHPMQPLYSCTDALEPHYPYTAASEEDIVRISHAFIEDASLREACGNILRERFQQSFSPSVVRGKLLALLEEVAA